MKSSDKILAELLLKDLNIETPGSEGIALGYMMREWLRNSVVDSDTAVDSATGMDAFDLWATVEGVEYFITIQKSSKQKQNLKVG